MRAPGGQARSACRRPRAEHADAMRFAVAHVEDAVRAGTDAMRARQRAVQRVAVGSIAARPRAEYGRDHAGPQVDAPDGVVLGVRYEEALAADGEALGATERGQPGRAAIARVALRPGAGHVVNRAAARYDPVDRVAFAQREIDRAVVADGDGPRPVERRV